MSVISFPRGELTAVFLDHIDTRVELVGDGVAPDDGGWDDDPNKSGSTYSPYVVVNPMTLGSISGALAESMGYIIAPYSLTFYGISREQLEFMSDRTREAAINLARAQHTFQGLDQSSLWKIMMARCDSIGGVSRSDAVEASVYTQTDVISIHISKEFT